MRRFRAQIEPSGSGMRAGSDPGPDAEYIDANAKEIGGDESKLAGAEANDANNHAVDSSQNETGPAPLTDEKGGKNSKTAR
jgi:hypothetical protein